MCVVTGAASQIPVFPHLPACHLCFSLTSTPNTAFPRAGISRLWFVPSRFPSLFSSSSQRWTFPQEEESGLFTPSLWSLPKSPLAAAPGTWNSPSYGLVFSIGFPSLQIRLIPYQMTRRTSPFVTSASLVAPFLSGRSTGLHSCRVKETVSCQEQDPGYPNKHQHIAKYETEWKCLRIAVITVVLRWGPQNHSRHLD